MFHTDDVWEVRLGAVVVLVVLGAVVVLSAVVVLVQRRLQHE